MTKSKLHGEGCIERFVSVHNPQVAVRICVVANSDDKGRSAIFICSREATKECSPRRKPWVVPSVGHPRPEGAKEKLCDEGGDKKMRG